MVKNLLLFFALDHQDIQHAAHAVERLQKVCAAAGAVRIFKGTGGAKLCISGGTTAAIQQQKRGAVGVCRHKMGLAIVGLRVMGMLAQLLGCQAA